MKKVFKPLWSYNIIAIEKWLADMALQGFHLVAFTRFTRCFYFQSGKPKVITYRIGFEKRQGNSLPNTLLREGWKKIVHAGDWYITTNEQPVHTITIFPDCEGIMKRNQIMSYIFTGILIYLGFLLLVHSSTLALIYFSWDLENPSSDWLFIGLFILIVVCGISFYAYSLYKIKKSTGYFLDGHRANARIYTNIDKTVTKFKLDWTFAPDKLENWLESMEAQGFHLYKMNKRGRIFHFIKGHPRKVKYCVDYRSSSNRSYFDIHQGAGWKEVFSSHAMLEKWTIWRQEYTKGETRPHIYDDKHEHIKQAKRITVQHTIYLSAILALDLLMISSFFERRISNNIIIESDFLFVISILLSLIVIVHALTQTWLYFNRIRSRYMN
jgi:hypothetical protein